MADHWQILLACALFMLVTYVHSQDTTRVPIKIIDEAAEKGAVCIDGTPAGYHYSPGVGDGVNNWLIMLGGGGWCWGNVTCASRIGKWNGSTKNITPEHFGGLVSSNQTLNPDFYNWNRVFVRYCDGGSFIGDNEQNSEGIDIQLRGSRIFKAAMDELLEMGMKNADNAILSGFSAGGLATTLNCDNFQALLPNAHRVKCLSGSGYFIRAKDLPGAQIREGSYATTISYHNLTSYLPSYCTSKMDPNLCLFPEYLVPYVKTPLFLINSAFDLFQIQFNNKKYPTQESWFNCLGNTSVCSPEQRKRISDFGSAFHTALDVIGNNTSTGLFINSCLLHDMMNYDSMWTNKGYGVEDTTMAQAFADWYFDRRPVRIIDTQHDFPIYCNPI